MYSFQPSQEQKILIDSVNRFASKELRSTCRQADENAEPDPGWLPAGNWVCLLEAFPTSMAGLAAARP